MQRECPEWAAYIGLVVRLLANESRNEPLSMVALLRQIDDEEHATHCKNRLKDSSAVDPDCSTQ